MHFMQVTGRQNRMLSRRQDAVDHGDPVKEAL